MKATMKPDFGSEPSTEFETIEPAQFLEDVREVMRSTDMARSIRRNQLDVRDEQLPWLRDFVVNVLGKVAGTPLLERYGAELTEGAHLECLKLVELSARPSVAVTPIIKTEPRAQEEVCGIVISDYAEHTELLADEDGNVRPLVWRKNPALYRSPGELREFYARHPTVPTGYLREVCMRHRGDWESALSKYVNKRGYPEAQATDAMELSLYEPDRFISWIRELHTAGFITLKGGSSRETRAVASRVRAKATEWWDSTDIENVPESSELQHGFAKMIQDLANAADQAWRKGKLSGRVTETTPGLTELFQHYAVEYLTTCRILSKDEAPIPKHVIYQAPLLRHSPEGIQTILDEHPSIPLSYMSEMIIGYPQSIRVVLKELEERIVQYTERYSQLPKSYIIRVLVENREPPDKVLDKALWNKLERRGRYERHLAEKPARYIDYIRGTLREQEINLKGTISIDERWGIRAFLKHADTWLTSFAPPSSETFLSLDSPKTRFGFLQQVEFYARVTQLASRVDANIVPLAGLPQEAQHRILERLLRDNYIAHRIAQDHGVGSSDRPIHRFVLYQRPWRLLELINRFSDLKERQVIEVALSNYKKPADALLEINKRTT